MIEIEKIVTIDTGENIDETSLFSRKYFNQHYDKSFIFCREYRRRRSDRSPAVHDRRGGGGGGGERRHRSEREHSPSRSSSHRHRSDRSRSRDRHRDRPDRERERGGDKDGHRGEEEDKDRRGKKSVLSSMENQKQRATFLFLGEERKMGEKERERVGIVAVENGVKLILHGDMKVPQAWEMSEGVKDVEKKVTQTEEAEILVEAEVMKRCHLELRAR